MIRKSCFTIIATNLVACSSVPFIPPTIEKQRTYDLPATQIIDILGNGLPNFLESTSSKTSKVEVKKVEATPGKPGVALIITDYKPKDSNFTECSIADHGGWANKYNGLDHGVIGIVLTPSGSKATTVLVNSVFHENYSVTVPGDVKGYVGGYAVRDTAYLDLGSHCYSTGIIERSIFDLIQGGAVGQSKVVADPGETLILDEEFVTENADDSGLKRYVGRVSSFNEHQLKNLVKTTMEPKFDFSARDANSLGILYAKGVIVPKNEATAFKLFEKAATSESVGEPDGTTAARYNLGMMYEKGLGTTKNEAKALKFLQSTAREDWPQGQTKLGFVYAKGLLGLKKDETKAAKLFTQVVIKHPPEGSYFIALRNLGYMYSQGLGVKKNDVAAYVCYKIIAEQGEAKAQKSVDIIGARLTSDQLREAQALHDTTKFTEYLENSLYNFAPA